MKNIVYLNFLFICGITLISCSDDDSGSGLGSGSGSITVTAESEPNDTTATANVVAVGSELRMATIGNLGVDTDYYSFTIDAIGTYFVNPSVQCTIDQTVWLYDTDGVTALIDGQDADNGIGPDNPEANCETIIYDFDTVGTYFLRVEELSQSAEGVYGVEVTSFASLIDEVEPNDSFDTASAITIGAAPFAATIGNSGLDTDYFSFEVDTTGVEYTINPSVGCSFDQQVWLYDTDGITALIDGQDADNGIGPDNTHGNCETISYTFDTIGTYFLRVQELDQSGTGIYSVQISTP